MAQYRQSGTDRFAARSHHDAGEQINIRIPHKSCRVRRAKPQRGLPPAVVTFSLTLLAVFILSLIVFYGMSVVRETPSRLDEEGTINQSAPRSRLERSLAFKELKFGQFSDGSGRDSRYWDGDDRRRDNDYSEEDATDRNSGSDAAKRKLPEERKAESFYNEGGREELDSYRKKYEVSLKNGGRSKEGARRAQVNPFDEYDDGIDEQDGREETGEEENGVHHSDDGEVVSAGGGDGIRKWIGANVVKKGILLNSNVNSSVEVSKDAGDQWQMDGAGDSDGTVSKPRLSGSENKAGLKRKPNHHKTSRSSCEIKFLNSTALLVEPLENKNFSRFLLQYTQVEERLSGAENWEPRFAGHQSPLERNQSYFAHDQKIKCGFIKGPPRSPSTGFDVAEDDMKYMGGCHIAVSSCIFGNSDHIRKPSLKTITRQSRRNVCFVMFVDEITLQTLLSDGQKMDSLGFIGLWKIVVVRNLPFPDMRRVGKIPKFLSHRLFPSARYSIWLDSKLRLQNDPYLILEYFLWRKGYEYAISNHYDRHCVWEEVAQNKKLNKYNHTVIDEQFAFYQSDGLKRFDPSDPNRLLPSYVPEGSFIVRAHTPMSNLFSCLWFNEVDSWTPRDQLSFAYTYLKLRRMNPGKNFQLNMFKDCERRTIAKLFRHRAEDKRNIPIQ